MMFLTMMLLSDPSFAGSDAKRYPGVMCRRLDSTSNTHIYYGQLFNTSTSSIDVECPVVRDLTTDVSSSYIYVFDNSSKASVTCALYNHRSTTASFYWTGHFSTSSSGYSSYATKLTTGALTTYSTDSLYFWCQLPGSDKGDSGIGWYYVDEV